MVKNRSIRILTLAGALFLLGSELALAQAPCTQNLRRGRTLYDEGKFQEMVNLLSLTECLRSVYTPEEKQEALKLITLGYIFMDEPAKSDEFMLELLRENPEYPINPEVDPAEFINLYNTFRTLPIFNLGGKFAGNVAFPNAGSTNLLAQTVDAFGMNPSIEAGIIIEVPFTKRLLLTAEIVYARRSFEQTNNAVFLDFETGEPFSFNQATEIQDWLELPVGVQYKFFEDRTYKPYIHGGMAITMLLKAEKTAERIVLENQDIRLNTFDVTAQRREFNFYAFAGVGVKRKLGRGFLRAELRYAYGILQANMPEGAFENNELVWGIMQVDQNFHLNHMSLSLGYVAHIYNPKKKKIK